MYIYIYICTLPKNIPRAKMFDTRLFVCFWKDIGVSKQHILEIKQRKQLLNCH